MSRLSTRISRYTLDADRVISAATIHVSGVMVSNSTVLDASVEFQDNDGNVLFNLVVEAHTSADISWEWVADNGLKAMSIGDADVVVAVWHSSGGA